MTDVTGRVVRRIVSGLLCGGAALAFSGHAQAQTVCGAVGGVVDCADGVDPVATGTIGGATVLVPGPGLVGTSATDAVVDLTGDISTNVAATPGVLITAGNDLLLDLAGTVTTTAANSSGTVLTAGGNIDATVEDILTTGLNSDGLVATALGDLLITTDNVATVGNLSDGLVLTADSITAVCGTVETTGDNSIGIVATAAAALNLTCGTVATTGAASDGLILNGTDITADVGTITTDGIGSDALIATATGDLDITSDTIATLGPDSDGLVLTAENITAVCGSVTAAGDNSIAILATADAALSLTCATVETTGAASDGVVVSGTDVTLDLDTVTTDGIGSDAIVATATGDLDVTSDTVVTLQDDSGGLVLSAENVTTVCGTVTTMGDNSIAVDITANGTISFTCAEVATSGDGSGGVIIDGGSGPVVVDVGVVTTDGAGSDGVVVTTDDGDQVIVTGPVTVNGPGSNGVVGTAAGCADVNITATAPVYSADGTAILASSLCTVTVTTLPGATVEGADAGIDVTSGTGATINLGDTVSATDGPAIIVAGAPVVINVGATGEIIGNIDLTDGNDTLNNGGTFTVIGTSDFGGGTDVINNLPDGIISSTDGAGVLANCEAVNNAGLITMVDGAADDTLTLCGNYTGSGDAELGIDVDGSGAGLTADELIILGNAGGSTGVTLNLLPGSAVVDPNGVIIVDAATVTGTPFTLNGPQRAGLIDYSLVQQGADTYLVSNANPAVFDVAGLAAIGRDLWYLSAEANDNCAASRRWQRRDASTTGFGVCGLVYYADSRYGDSDETATAFGTPFDYNGRFKTKGKGIQGDLTYMLGGHFTLGVTGGWARATARAGDDSRLRGSGYNYGAFAEFGGWEGLFARALFKHDRYRLRYANGLLGLEDRVRGSSTGFDGAVGFRMPAMGATADLLAGLSHVKSKTREFDLGFLGFRGKSTSTRGRLAGRLQWNGSIAPYVGATLFHEFNDRASVRVLSGLLEDRIDAPGRGTWGRIEAGIGGSERLAPILALWGEFGDVKGWGARAGFLFGPGPAMAVAEPVIAGILAAA